MRDINSDWQALHDSMGDFSNTYGDQKLIECMTEWLNAHMGSKWEIKKQNLEHDYWGINYAREIQRDES